jgi:glycerol-3-phosphate cytidylyltransferase
MLIYKRCLTTGVFDLLHYGHLNILKKCKKLSKHVIVGVQKDEDVFNSKGKYPTLSTKERIKTLTLLLKVDKCISYSGSTKNIKDLSKIINKIKPDLIVQGSDWNPSKEMKKYLKEKNIKLVLVPYTKNISTTSIKKRVNENL